MTSIFCSKRLAERTFAEFRVELDEVDVYLGQDDSRQANEMNYEIEQLVARGSYTTEQSHHHRGI